MNVSNKTKFFAVAAIALAAMFAYNTYENTVDELTAVQADLAHFQASRELETSELREQLVASEAKYAALHENMEAMVRRTAKSQYATTNCVAALEIARDGLVNAEHDFAKISTLAGQIARDEPGAKERLFALMDRK